VNVYSLVVALHVVSLVFCAGPLLALALVFGELSPSAIQRLSRVASFGLLGLLVTGVGAVAMTGEAFVHTGWFRVSMVLFLIIGGLTGWLRRLTRKPESGDRVRTLAWTITVGLALVVYLMEGKPF
jgi:cytochrome bd-type quinol oxidase subunit 2